MSGPNSTQVVDDDLDRFMADHYSGVVRSVAVACGDVVLARDAVHEALARAMEQRRRGRSIDHCRAGSWS